MPRRLRTQAIVMNRDESGESHRLVTLFTEQFGKMRVFAPGARRSKRRFAGCLELFALIDASIAERSRGLAQLEEASLIDPHEPIKSDLIAIGHAGYLVELAAALLGEGDVATEIYDLVKESLSRLKQGPLKTFELRRFEMTVLVHAGLGPHFSSCVSCGAESSKIWRFDFEQGGLLCGNCQASPTTQPMGLSQGAVSLLRQVQSGAAPKRLESADMGAARKLLAVIIDSHVGKPLKAREFLVQIAKKS